MEEKARSQRAPTDTRGDGWQPTAISGKPTAAPPIQWRSGTLPPPHRRNAEKSGFQPLKPACHCLSSSGTLAGCLPLLAERRPCLRLLSNRVILSWAAVCAAGDQVRE